jgi:hypothetical protein
MHPSNNPSGAIDVAGDDLPNESCHYADKSRARVANEYAARNRYYTPAAEPGQCSDGDLAVSNGFQSHLLAANLPICNATISSVD